MTYYTNGKTDAENKFNKQYGVYYTPREIVHYMCQQSLINYLSTELINGNSRESGNPVISEDEIETLIRHDAQEGDAKGRETGVYFYKFPESIRQNAKLIDEKLASIKVCDPAVGNGAFPVGMMTEIVKTRNALSSYIEEPNRYSYNFKRDCIQNSLYGVDIDPGAVKIAKLRLLQSLIVDEDNIKEIKPLSNLDYKIMQGNSLLLDWELHFAEVFNEKGGFDVVIANPPYIQLQKDHGKLANLYQNKGFETFNRRGDIYTLFYEKGIQLLRDNGHLCFISSNKWMRAEYAKELRSFFLKYDPTSLIDLGPDVFKCNNSDGPTVDTNILVIQKKGNNNNLLAADIKEYISKNCKEVLNQLTIYIEKKELLVTNLTNDAWFIGSSAEQRLKEKIERIGKPLKDWDVNIYRGIVTGYNKAFIIDAPTKERLCKENSKSAEIFKPILRGRDIKPYSYGWKLWLLFIPWHFPLHKDETIQGVSKKAEEEFKKQYPAIYNHLLQFKNKLKKRNKDETGIRYEWYALQRCANTYYLEFDKEKVVWQEIVREPSFAYDSTRVYCNDTTFLMVGKKLKYLLGMLNSKSVAYFFKTFYAGGGLGSKGYRYKKEYLEQLPIPPITPQNQPIVKQIEDLVDKIVSAKRHRLQEGNNLQVDTSNWEKEIDQLIYKLYDLTEEEIKNC
jgi:type I restriction-modification system DNA methylase subunit